MLPENKETANLDLFIGEKKYLPSSTSKAHVITCLTLYRRVRMIAVRPSFSVLTLRYAKLSGYWLQLHIKHTFKRVLVFFQQRQQRNISSKMSNLSFNLLETHHQILDLLTVDILLTFHDHPRKDI